MKTFEVKGELRKEIGKKNASQLRKEEKIPCVIYGGKENVHFSASEKEFLNLIYTPNVYIAKIKLENAEYNAVMREIQVHPVSDKVIHIDFLQVFDDKNVTVPVPVKLNGFAKGVKEGGKLNLERRKLKVSGFPNAIPDIIEIDVTDVELGKTIKVGDIKIDNVKLTDSSNTVVASVKLTRAAKGMEVGETPVAAAAAATTTTPPAETPVETKK
ncbi:MAG: 50S ribosomal protein L25/general stress protein Ctc [Bacteroidetes bacterium GWA2_30_7]|nr:MAG: 50S ribosomal protein L25/general stress protein Ctc [Bacteroidetes bacterium GWA2_30_7]